jgi:hypothetical protein
MRKDARRPGFGVSVWAETAGLERNRAFRGGFPRGRGIFAEDARIARGPAAKPLPVRVCGPQTILGLALKDVRNPRIKK